MTTVLKRKEKEIKEKKGGGRGGRGGGEEGTEKKTPIRSILGLLEITLLISN